ncbi:hypothetical protein AAFN86_14745 [Roseomonas sp. CAU 1739]|uniref:hypothetical protein n=1 Tax=Roseomonas sp. CAU 1739 TaxID=3140364 RepID=UPI00325ACA0F
MPRYAATLSLSDLERFPSQGFWFVVRRVVLRAVSGLALALGLIVWPLSGFAIEAPSDGMKVILLIFALVLAGGIAGHWVRMRRGLRSFRHFMGASNVPATASVPATIVTDDAGVGLVIPKPGEAGPDPAHVRAWMDVTEVLDTRDFIVILTEPPKVPLLLPKSGLSPQDVNALRAEIAARRAATAS